MSTRLPAASFVALLLKAKGELSTGPRRAKSGAILKNTLSFRTKKSHVHWLLITAVAVTGSAPQRLLSDAQRKKRIPND